MEKKTELSKFELQSRQRIIQLIQEFCDGSQQRFVEKTGINKGSVSQYVRGNNTPSNLTAKKIADAFKVAPAWVMGFDVPRSMITPFENESKTDEAILLDNFRELTDEGKKKVLDYILVISQSMQYSLRLQNMQATFNDGKDIENYEDAILFLNQAGMPMSAESSPEHSKDDIIMIANAVKKNLR